MKSLAYIPGSNQAANASLMTVQNVRAAGASDIIVNTVTGAPAKFYGSMGAPHTFIDPVTGETITIISEATAVDFAAHLDSGKVVIDAIAPGYVDTRGSLVGDIVVIRPVTEWANNIFNVLSESHNDDGTLKTTAITYEPNTPNTAESGGIWTLTTGLNGAMSALVAYIDGYRGTVAAVASRAFTASKDTYIDVLRNTTTNAFTLVYTEVANNAAAPTLAANSYRLAIVVSSGSTLTRFVQDGSQDSEGYIIYRTVNTKNIQCLNVDIMPNQPATASGAYQIINDGYPLPIRTSTGRLLIEMSIPLSISANNGQVAVLINGTYYDVINTSGVDGRGITGKRLISGLPKNVKLVPTMYFRIAGGATIAFIQFRHMSWSVEEV